MATQYLLQHWHLLSYIITENDELSAARVVGGKNTGLSFNAEIDSGVCEFSSTDVQVTCHVRSVVLLGNCKSRWNFLVETGAAVDKIVYTFADMLGGCHTQTVEPLYG